MKESEPHDATGSKGEHPGTVPNEPVPNEPVLNEPVLYQPVIDLARGDLRGVEATLPTLDRLAEACAQASAWQGGLDGLRLSVALAPARFFSAGLPGTVADALASSGLSPHRLELAVAERALLVAPSIARGLRSLGVGLAVDLFGRGNVSLGVLRYPYVDTLRLDPALVAALSRPLDAPQFALAVIEAAGVVATHLDLRLVAVGVDTERQLELLRDLGCRLGRGRRFGGPVSAADFTLPARREDERP